MVNMLNGSMLWPFLMMVSMAILSTNWIFDRKTFPLGITVLVVGILGFANDLSVRHGYKNLACIMSFAGIIFVLYIVFNFGVETVKFLHKAFELRIS